MGSVEGRKTLPYAREERMRWKRGEDRDIGKRFPILLVKM